MTKKTALFLLILIAGLSSCKRQKLQKQTLPSLAATTSDFRSVDSVSDSLNIPVRFRYLSARSKISIKSKQQNIDNASVTFRIKKDSAIWMSAHVMGLEVIRGVISVEGVRIMDRINKVYTETSYRALAQKLGFPLDYTLLQSFFLADVPVYPGQGVAISDQGDHLIVKQEDGYLAVFNKISRLQKKTLSIEAIDLISNNRARANYDNIEPVAYGQIPYSVILSLTGKPGVQPAEEQKISVSLTHNSVMTTDSSLSFPFQVPINYKKAF